MQKVLLSKGPSEAMASPPGISQLMVAMQWDLPSPATSLNLHFPPDPSGKSTEWLWQDVHL